ncbi:MAG: DUF2851 family protein, partial [Muribaculaceae bacterium]|nr:DUF2851 family protein [Muribaculaceae bacterium]
VWQHRLWIRHDMSTVDGRPVHIIDQGLLNRDSGPDFFNAKVKIGGQIWSGNIEIHVRASDWHRHGHDSDPAYDSVILHVVDKDDMPVYRTNGELIPQMRMPCSRDFGDRFRSMVENTASELACSSEISSVPQVHLTGWIDSLAYQRLYAKTDRIASLVERFNGDWEEACYVTLARALGFGINGEPFQRLALSLPLRFMRKHSDSLLAMEALLFGQAGLLDKTHGYDPYVERITSEYRFLATKFSLRQPQSLGWKTARMRPPNFPHRRIALLAAMMHGGFRMMHSITDARNATDAEALFRSPLTGYWASRFTFGPDSGRELPVLSEPSIRILLINVVVPMMYAYGLSRDDSAMCQRAIDMLQHLPAEHNSITNMFTKAGINCRDAFTSQALIELRRSFCETRKCLYCRIGHRLLAAKTRP